MWELNLNLNTVVDLFKNPPTCGKYKPDIYSILNTHLFVSLCHSLCHTEYLLKPLFTCWVVSKCTFFSKYYCLNLANSLADVLPHSPPFFASVNVHMHSSQLSTSLFIQNTVRKHVSNCSACLTASVFTSFRWSVINTGRPGAQRPTASSRSLCWIQWSWPLTLSGPLPFTR